MGLAIRAVLVTLAVAVAPVVVAACGNSTDTSGSGGTGGTATAILYGVSDCGKCVEKEACAAQLNACAADPDCAAYLDCLDKCPLGTNGDADVACEQACPAVPGSAGQAAKSDFIKCRTSGAGAQCVECGKIDEPTNPIFHQTCPPNPPPEDVGNKCYTCEDLNCCETFHACYDDPDCKALGDCVKACPDLACWDQCFQDHAAVYPKYGDRLACVLHFCADDDACGDVPLDPCIACDNLHCGDEDAACYHDLQCTLLRDCETPCNPLDSACRSNCEALFPDGKALLTAWADCAVAHCTVACGGSTP